LRHFITLIDTVKWLVRANGRYTNVWAYRLQTGTMNFECQWYHYFVGPVITGRTILANWPGIALHDKNEKTCLLIDIAIHDDSNVNTKETEKLSKYKDL